MKYVFNKMYYSPEGAQEPITAQAANSTTDVSEDGKEEKKTKLSFFQKIRKALQEWSNGDQADRDFDDTRV